MADYRVYKAAWDTVSQAGGEYWGVTRNGRPEGPKFATEVEALQYVVQEQEADYDRARDRARQERGY